MPGLPGVKGHRGFPGLDGSKGKINIIQKNVEKLRVLRQAYEILHGLGLFDFPPNFSNLVSNR